MLKNAPAGKGTCAITLTNETVMTARIPFFPLSALVFMPTTSPSRPPSSDAEAALYLFIIIAGGLSLLGGLVCALKRHRISMENPTFSKDTVKLPPFARPPHDALFVRDDGRRAGRTHRGFGREPLRRLPQAGRKYTVNNWKPCCRPARILRLPCPWANCAIRLMPWTPASVSAGRYRA